jgi:hypothetical protein
VTLSFPRAWRVLIPAALVAAATVGVVLAVGAHSSTAAGPAAPSATVVKQFAIFNRASVASDALPAEAGPSPAAASVVRRVATGTSSLSQWATLSGNQACVVIDGTAPGAHGAPAACGTLEPAHEESELLTIVAGESGPDAPTVLAGLIEDGVTDVTITLANGTTHTVPVVENGFHLLTGGSEPTAYSWTSASGAKYTQNLKGS